METSSTSQTNNNKIITYIAVAIGAVVMISTIQMFVKAVNQSTSMQEAKIDVRTDTPAVVAEEPLPENQLGQYERYLADAANEVNKRCPIMIDRETRLDNAMALPNNEFQYSYTLINTQHDMVDVQSVSAYIRPTLLNMVRSTPDLQTFRDNRTKLSYSYNDMNGVFLFKLSFDADEYAY